MHLVPLRLVEFGWLAIGAIWLAAAIGTKRTARRMPRGALLAHILALGVCFNLVFARYLKLGVLDARFVPRAEWVAWTGFAVAMAGFAFTVWARYRIGRNWSGTVEVKQEHTLVREGPYGLVRHPIYTGLSLALLGTALAYGELRCLLGAVLTFFEWKRKSLLEERFMLEQFGREYVEYRRQVKGLIPFVW